MQEQSKKVSSQPLDHAATRAWATPKLTRMGASEAEVGTRAAIADGGFTTS
jgi:hypothetical protein